MYASRGSNTGRTSRHDNNNNSNSNNSRTRAPRASSQSSSPSPSPSDVIALAERMNYSERRPTTSSTLFFKEQNPPHSMPPILINIYYTTRSIMTYLNHPESGSNELWRSNAYESIEELGQYFANPRMHSGKGYRNKNKAVRGCVKCGETRERVEFSKNQWVKGPDLNTCKECIGAGRGGASVTDAAAAAIADVVKSEDISVGLGSSFDQLSLNSTAGGGGDTLFPTLTQDLLRINNKTISKGKTERRQFNCPDCPKHNRGKFIFFKKVPCDKPIVKCPNCKLATRGRCKRLHPIPKHQERGYGLFKCLKCKDTWGSSRAIANIGQQCQSCFTRDRSTAFVRPFRLEVHKKKKKGRTGAGGAGASTGGARSMVRAPKHTIREDEEEDIGYGNNDYNRNSNAAGNALAKSRDESSDMYEYRPRPSPYEDTSEEEGEGEAPSATIPGLTPTKFTHKCEGCAKGLCRRKNIPKSAVHEISDGDTVTTRASVVTNSSVDKNDFLDRDFDFDDFEDDEHSWIEV